MQQESTTVICPFDRNHLIDKSRFQRHIIKCRKNFPPGYMESCAFNATHIMLPSELEQHEKNCPDKRFIQPEKYEILKNHGSLRLCQSSQIEAELSNFGENWENRMADFNDATSLQGPSSSEKSFAKSENLQKRVRPPKTLCVSMMMDDSEYESVSDMESVATESTAFGRGPKSSSIPYHLHKFRDDMEDDFNFND